MYPAYVYKVTCTLTGQYYYGYRCYNMPNKSPENDLWKRYYTSSKEVQALIEQHGKGAFEVQVLATSFNKDDVFWWEQELIKAAWWDPLLLNKHRNVNGKRVFRVQHMPHKNGKRNPSIGQKVSATLKAKGIRPPSPKGKPSPTKGKPKSDEHRKALSEAAKKRCLAQGKQLHSNTNTL